MGERRGTKALELWCRRATDGYPGVDVSNMTTSWRNGLAFCALIHRFRPDLIDFDSLHPGNALQNNELAFRTAERHLGIPALLDAEDMVDSSTPDRLSVLTYLAQFYQAFGHSSLALGNMSPNRSSPSTKCSSEEASDSNRPSEESQAKKVWQLPRDPCAMCGLPVFLAERLACSGRTFHRPCFKCARCGAQLSPANYYETESHSFCCEVCPDEEPVPESSSDNDSMSVSGSCDEYSANLETVLDPPAPLDASLAAFLCSQLEPPASSLEDLALISPDNLNCDYKTNCSQETLVNENNLRQVEETNSTSLDNRPENTLIQSSSLVNRRRSLFENLTQKVDNVAPPVRKPSLVTVPTITCSDDVASEAPQVPVVLPDEKSSDLPAASVLVESDLEVIAIEKPVEEAETLQFETIDVSEPKGESLQENNDLEQSLLGKPEIVTPVPAVRRVLTKNTTEIEEITSNEGSMNERKSTNPFGSSDEEDEIEDQKPTPRAKKIVPVDAHLNPFWEADQEDTEQPKPVPRPRSSHSIPGPVTSTPTKKKQLAPPPPPSPAHHSPSVTPQGSLRPPRKSKPAPKPPGSSSSPAVERLMQLGEKGIKDELNRTRQGLLAELRQELEMIETQQRGLEKQGVRLEEQIREQLAQLGCDNDDATLPEELEDSQRLEEQQADLEWQIRCLLQKPGRTEDDMKKEEDLIARLVALVEQRNQIVDCLEMDRKREVDEDQSVRERLQMLSPDRHQQPPKQVEETSKSKKKKGKLRLLPKDKSKSKDKSEEKKLKAKEKEIVKETNLKESTKESTGESSKKTSKKRWFS
ncbi:hypothetical protein B566_EDAN002834 [Ephemera danica]|nr:hypothetical protein B566_EDAN002834 [Ephemera danica]